MKTRTKQILVISLLILGLLIILGLILDIRRLQSSSQTNANDVNTELKNMIAGMSKMYSDPQGRFTIVQPQGWHVARKPKSHPYDVSFHSRHGASLSIMVTPATNGSFNSMLKKIEETQKTYGLNMNISPTNHHGIPAITRRTTLMESEIHTLDFIHNNTAHHIQASIQYDILDKYAPIIHDIIKTYKPQQD